MTSQSLCNAKKEYHMGSFNETPLGCDDIDVFKHWKERVNEGKAKPLTTLLQDQYNIPLFEPPTQGSLEPINSLYQSKYGLFTCLDSQNYLGLIELEPSLITYWERTPDNLSTMWYLSIAYAISVGALKFEELSEFRKDYKQSQKYKKFMKRNPNHNEKLKHMMQEQLTKELCQSDEDRNAKKLEIDIQVMSYSINHFRN